MATEEMAAVNETASGLRLSEIMQTLSDCVKDDIYDMFGTTREDSRVNPLASSQVRASSFWPELFPQTVK